MKTKNCEVCGDRMAVRAEEALGDPIQSKPNPGVLIPAIDPTAVKNGLMAISPLVVQTDESPNSSGLLSGLGAGISWVMAWHRLEASLPLVRNQLVWEPLRAFASL